MTPALDKPRSKPPKRLTNNERFDRWSRILQAMHADKPLWDYFAPPPYTCQDICKLLEQYFSPEGAPIKIAQSHMHRTLKQMVAAGLVTRERDKIQCFCALAGKGITRVCVVYWRTQTITADKSEVNDYHRHKRSQNLESKHSIKQYL